jgi:uncharacterized membrane protein
MASHIKSVAKAITWRVLGAADTFVLSFLVTGKATAAIGIVGFELFTKSMLYYGHERAWEISWLANPSRNDVLARSAIRLFDSWFLIEGRTRRLKPLPIRLAWLPDRPVESNKEAARNGS